MSQAEFFAWAEFYRRWPFDDYHRFHRPAALVSTMMMNGSADQVNEAIEARLQFLQPMDRAADKYTSADRDLFKAAGIRV